jgi:hypothetical protein
MAKRRVDKGENTLPSTTTTNRNPPTTPAILRRSLQEGNTIAMPPTPTRGIRVFTPSSGVGGEETRDLNAASKEGNGARSVASVVATAGHRFPRSRASRHHPANQCKKICPWDAGFTDRRRRSPGDRHRE